MSNAAQAYARTSTTTASPREIEAQALLKAARQLQDVQANWAGPDKAMHNALLFNRRLWTIFMSAADADDNPQPLEVRRRATAISARPGCWRPRTCSGAKAPTSPARVVSPRAPCLR